jgi:hypothetical protein
MRKLIVTGVIAAIGMALLAVPASASFDHHFTVLSKNVSEHQVGAHTFRFKDRLFDPQNRHDRVGRDRGRCREAAGGKSKCGLLLHLNGEIGGFGDIRVKGDLGPHDNRLNVVGGTADFNGVAGKMIVHGLNGPPRFHLDLVR